jgi:ornithine carbamoyltransferase
MSAQLSTAEIFPAPAPTAKSQHLLSGAELNSSEIQNLLDLSALLKKERQQHKISNALFRKQLALLFDKASLRTRFSFTTAMRELGGNVIESVSYDRKDEDPEDQMRVLQGYCHAVMVRASDDSILERMKSVASIPIINGLSDLYHPCQTLADLLTLQETFGNVSGMVLSYIGDGNNVLHSLLLMAPLLGIHVRYCCPVQYSPSHSVLKAASLNTGFGSITCCHSPTAAVTGSDAVYTDVWTSMGFGPKDESIFDGYQVNESLMKKANKKAVFMHCMPMLRGKEVSHDLPDQPCSVIFQQSENRLHVQKALLLTMLS